MDFSDGSSAAPALALGSSSAAARSSDGLVAGAESVFFGRALRISPAGLLVSSELSPASWDWVGQVLRWPHPHLPNLPYLTVYVSLSLTFTISPALNSSTGRPSKRCHRASTVAPTSKIGGT